MKKFIVFFMVIAWFTSLGQVGINSGGSSPDGSAMLDVKSTEKGFLPPRVADTNAINTPAEGLQVYDLSSHCMRYYNGTKWSECMGISSWPCGVQITINHVAGAVAPVTKTVTYGTVTNIPGETSKCWITSNLGADQQATAVNDASEASAGWYWQFNRKQGYKHDGTTVTPSWTITYINENLDWEAANDPCTLELGSGWRIPTYTEWNNVDNTGGWTNWNGPWNSGLKMHAAGSTGNYWSSTQWSTSFGGGWDLVFGSIVCFTTHPGKASGLSLRCLRD